MNYAILFNLESLHSEFSAPLLIILFVSFLNQLFHEEKNWRIWSPADEKNWHWTNMGVTPHGVNCAAVFAVKSVLLTAFATRRSWKKSEAGRQKN